MFGRVAALEARVEELSTLLEETRTALHEAAHAGTAEATEMLQAMEQLKADNKRLNGQHAELKHGQVVIAAEVAKHSNTFARLIGGLSGVVGQFMQPQPTAPQGDKVGPAGVTESGAVASLPREQRRQIKRQRQRDLRDRSSGDQQAQAQ